MISTHSRPSLAGAFTLAMGGLGIPAKITGLQLPTLESNHGVEPFFFGGPGPIVGALSFELTGMEDQFLRLFEHPRPRTFAEITRLQRRAKRAAKRAKRSA